MCRFILCRTREMFPLRRFCPAPVPPLEGPFSRAKTPRAENSHPGSSELTMRKFSVCREEEQGTFSMAGCPQQSQTCALARA